MLRIKELHDQVNPQAVELGRWSRTLEQRVEEQVQQLERLGRLKRFVSPALAEAIVGGSTDDPFRTHRREIAMIILNLGGLSAFAETAEPEEVMGALRQYHAEMGRIVLAHEATLVRFVGDMVDVLVNDSVEVPNPTLGATGFEERLDYGAVGRVTVHTAFLCQAARPDRILVSQGVAAAVESFAELEEVEPLRRDGFARPIRAFRVGGLKQPANAAG
jgi:adenylate cyclase